MDAYELVKQRAINFRNVLRIRLHQHIVNKIKDTSKHHHWCLTFTRDNINRFAAMISYFGHTVRDARRVNKNESLLRSPTAGFVHTIEEKWEACYLHFDNDAGVLVRSGKSALGSDSSSPRATLLNHQRGHEKMVATCGVIDGTTFYLRHLTSSNSNKLKDAK